MDEIIHTLPSRFMGSYHIGPYVIDEKGITNQKGERVSATPIFPLEIQEQNEFEKEKLCFAYLLQGDGYWEYRELTVNINALTNTNKILGLASYGISVCGGPRARKLVKFFKDVIMLYESALPIIPSELVTLNMLGIHNYF